MQFPKRYGQSKIESCPFCERQATTRNSQDIPVCYRHKEAVMNELKCCCGEYLEPRSGKFGLYFFCQRCGNVNKKRVLEFNQVRDVSPGNSAVENGSAIGQKSLPKKEPKEIFIRSDDPDYFD